MDEIYKLFSRIKQTDDGKQFINYLEKESNALVTRFKLCESQYNDYLKGKLVAIDDILNVFEKCDDKLKSKQNPPKEWL